MAIVARLGDLGWGVRGVWGFGLEVFGWVSLFVISVLWKEKIQRDLGIWSVRDISYVPIGRNDKDVTVHGQVFAIATADVETDRAGCQSLQKTFNDRPRLS